MNHFIDITILPDSEFSTTTLMNALYSKLHKVLCDLKSTDIGVSFPNVKSTLGNCMRLHGTEESLSKLHQIQWWGRMKDYCQFGSVSEIPLPVKYRIVSRSHERKTSAKLKRLMNRGLKDKGTIEAYKENMQKIQQTGPYLMLYSGSSGQRYRRYIQHGELQDQAIAGEFDQFGLSKTATIPWF